MHSTVVYLRPRLHQVLYINNAVYGGVDWKSDKWVAATPVTDPQYVSGHQVSGELHLFVNVFSIPDSHLFTK